MKKNIFLLTLVVLAILYCLGFRQRKTADMRNIPADEQTTVIVNAANAFLHSLTEKQRDSISFDFTPQKAATAAKFQRTGNPGGSWSNQGKQSEKRPQVQRISQQIFLT